MKTSNNPLLKKKLLLALKKTQGTLSKVTQMVEEDTYCADIGQQINAAIGLLKSANMELMKNHLMCCGKTALSHKDTKE
jgi:DNA-binding FrmR family transcriptional regulator